MDPLGDALAHVLAVQVQRHGTGALEGRERFDHRHQLHAVVGGAEFATEQLFFGRARAQQHAPSAGAGVALAGAIGVNLYLVQTLFLTM